MNKEYRFLNKEEIERLLEKGRRGSCASSIPYDTELMRKMLKTTPIVIFSEENIQNHAKLTGTNADEYRKYIEEHPVPYLSQSDMILSSMMRVPVPMSADFDGDDMCWLPPADFDGDEMCCLPPEKLHTTNTNKKRNGREYEKEKIHKRLVKKLNK